MITSQQAFTHASLPGVKVYPISGDLKRGFQQQVLVCVEPGASIPLHSHSVDATMDPVAESAILLSRDPKMNGVRVSVGMRVFFEKNKDHGFVVPKGEGQGEFRFISTNDGIVDERGDWDVKMKDDGKLKVMRLFGWLQQAVKDAAPGSDFD